MHQFINFFFSFKLLQRDKYKYSIFEFGLKMSLVLFGSTASNCSIQTVSIEVCEWKDIVHERFHHNISKMILFKTIRENFSTLGIGIFHPACPVLLQLERIKVLIALFLNFLSVILYVFYGASDFLEVVSTIFLASIQLLSFLSVFNFIWDAKRIYNLLNNIEETIEPSKKRVPVFAVNGCFVLCKHINWWNFIGMVNATSKAIYNEADKKLQVWSKFMDLIIVKMTPIGVNIPTFVISLFKYLTTDLGDESFDMALHQW